jgi:hypothetical protein
LMGTLYQRPNSPCYWATYYDGTGKRVRVTTRTADKKEAKRFLKLREGAVAKGAPVPPRLDRVTFERAAGQPHGLLPHHGAGGST